MKRVVIASVVVLVMIAAIAVGYFYYQQVQTPVSESYGAIPHDAAIIAEVKDFKLLLEKLQTSEQWQELIVQQSVKSFNDQLLFIDSVATAHPDVSTLFQKKPVLVSFHTTKATDFDALYVVNMPQFKQESFINEIILRLTGDQVKLNKRIYNGVPVREFNYNNKYFAYTVYKGLFIASHTAILVEDAIRQLKSGSSIKSDKNFRRIHEAAGKNVDANIFINFSFLPRFISVYTTADNESTVRRIRNFSSWSQLDLTLKKESLILNGFTLVADSSQNLHTLQNQKPVATTILEILPRRTALFQVTALSDENLYKRNLNSYFNRTGYSEKYSLSVSDKSKLSAWVGGEICYFITESGSINFNNNVFVAIKASDIGLARKTLKEFGEKNNPAGYKEELYRGKTIGYINQDDIIPAILGEKYERINRFFYTYLNEFVIVGNQASSIRSIIDDHLSGRKLTADESFAQFNSELSETCNFYSYINIPRSVYIIKSYATTDYIRNFENNTGYLNKINAVAFQISSNDKLFYTNIHFDIGKYSRQGGVNMLWAAQLDTSVSMKPQLFVNHSTNANEIVVQDDAFNLYLIDNSGQILWKRKLDEKIMSPVYMVDLFKNGKWQMVFNTATRLYLIDRNRNNVGNFPIKLPAEATNALTVFDYDNNKDYRMFVACANGQVYSYLASGRPSAGWLFNRPTGTVTNPVQHFNIDGKDYLLVSDDAGKFYLLDRRGVVRAEAKQNISRSLNSEIFIEKDDNGRSYFVVTDTTGTIYSIFTDGTVYSKTVTPFSPQHKFIFNDVNSDQVKDYIFIDNNSINIYNKNNFLITNHNFKNAIDNNAEFYPFSNGKGKIGTYSTTANELYLVNDDGSMYDGFPLKGSTPFLLTDFNRDGTRKLITGSVDGNIYVYNFD